MSHATLTQYFDVFFSNAVKQHVEKVDVVIYRHACYVGKKLLGGHTQTAHKSLIKSPFALRQLVLLYVDVTEHLLSSGQEPYLTIHLGNGFRRNTFGAFCPLSENVGKILFVFK